MSSPIGFGVPPVAGEPQLAFTPTPDSVPPNDPRGQGDALSATQVLALQFAPITAAEVLATEGSALGESRQVSDGDNAGARIIWSTTPNNPTPSWRWWLWPDATYEGA